MLSGRARVTVIDPKGRNFMDDVEAGDIWNFPAGIPHSIQGLDDDGCEFLLVFDDGSFSENETFLISDWLLHTPPHILAKNFGVPESKFKDLPQDIEHTRWIFSGEVPGPIEQDKVHALQGETPVRYTYKLMQQPPIRAADGEVRIVDSRNFPAASTIAAALVVVEPGKLRELHWHSSNDEWQYFIRGKARMTVFASGGKARTFDYSAGDVGYVPFGMGHYLENIGDEPLVFLEAFKSSVFTDFSANQWLALSPPEMVKAHLNLDDETISALSKTKPLIV